MLNNALRNITVKAIENLSGHSIIPYQIHGGVGGKSVPLVKTDNQTKMEEGEYFAIETFGSTGRGRVVESVSFYLSSSPYNAEISLFLQGDVSHYAKVVNAPHVPLRYVCHASAELSNS